MVEIWYIARHELHVIVRTRRALLVLLLYLGLGVLGGGAYVAVVRTIEEKAAALLIQQGAEPDAAQRSLDLARDDGYRKLAGFFAGAEVDAMAPTLRESVILPAFFWCTLVFIPFVILLTSFDQLAPELATRSLCYSTLRVGRGAIVIGKVLAHGIVSMVLVGIGSIVLLAVAAGVLANVEFLATLPGLGRLWLLLVPFTLCYVALGSFCSSLTRSAFVALMFAIGAVTLLRALSWVAFFDEADGQGGLRHLRWLSPATYHDGLWLAGWTAPLASAGAYALFATAFVAASIAVVRARDL